MADKKISQLTTLAQADVAVTADFLPIVDTSATETKKATPQALVQAGATGATLPVALGAVATPSYTFTGDLNTGLWSPAADTLAASTGGSERLRVDSNGNLGIGLTNPTSRLELYGGAAGTATYATIGNATTAGLFGVGTGNDVQVRTAQAVPITFYTSGIERMRLDSSGNLGIGTSSPQSKLHIDGGEYINSAGTLPALSTSIVSGEIHAGITNTATTDSGYLRLSAGGGTTLGVKAALDIFRESGGTAGIVGYTSGTERFRIDANGNVVAGGSAALATTATNGFLYVPTCAGVPTGVPTAITGMAPIVVNTTNNKLYFYSGGSWRDAGP
jgi:hypothetical protein